MAGFVWYGSKHEIFVRVYNEALETALAWNGRPHESDDLVVPGQRQAIGAPEQPHRGAPPPGHLLSAPESQQLRLAQVVHRYQICTEEICSKRLILGHLLHINMAQNSSRGAPPPGHLPSVSGYQQLHCPRWYTSTRSA